MPIFFQQDIDDSTKLGVWKIEEDEPFFLAKVPLHRSITHPHKRLQHLAGRYLLQYLFPDFPLTLIQIADTRKPFLEDEAYHFSISHCDDYAAVIVSKNKRVGVDIEIVSEKVQRIRHKFVSEDENDLLLHLLSEEPKDISSLLTMFWSCKEAVFKWYGSGEVDFKKHIAIKVATQEKNEAFSKVVFKKEEPVFLKLSSLFFDNLCLSYVATGNC